MAEQRLGLGKALVKDAFLRTLQTAAIAGVCAIVVDAIDDEVRLYYEKRGFEVSPIGSRQLFVKLDDLRAAIAAATLPKE